MSTAGHVPVTPGNGAKKVATYEVTEGGEAIQLQRQVFNDADGVELKGQRGRSQSLPATLAIEDLAALSAADPVPGVVNVPASSETVLSTPTRGIAIILAGNLGVKFADGTENNAKLIPVTAGQVLPFRVVQLTANNTAGVLGLK